MRKILILIGLCLGLAGCSTTYTQPLNLNQGTLPTANVNQSAINTADWKTYVSEKTGISFKYPAELGVITEDLHEPTGRITISADKVPFMSFNNPDYIVPEKHKDWASEGDWRTNAMYISDQAYIENICSNQEFLYTLSLEKYNCQVLINNNNIRYAKIFAEQALVGMESFDKNVTFYLAYNPNSDYDGIIVSDTMVKNKFEYIESVKDNVIHTEEVDLPGRFANIDQIIESIVQTIKFN